MKTKTYYHVSSGPGIRHCPRTIRNARKIVRRLRQQGITCICDRVRCGRVKYYIERVYRDYGPYAFDRLGALKK